MQPIKRHQVPKVLIVDDQPRNLDALEAMLGPADCVLVRAESADQALLELLRDDFAAIVLDIRMPGMSGIDLAKLIKQRKRSEHVPILFLTAHSVEDADVLKGYDVGAVDYLSKPVNASILKSKIGVFVDLFRKTQALGELNDRLHEEIAEREKAQEALRGINRDLESRVNERTAALARANQEVGENEERWRMAMKVARTAAWEWHLPSGQMTWSTDPEVLFGFPAGSFGAELRIFRILPLEDKMRVESAVAASLKSGSYEVEYRAARPDGTSVWITERGRVVPSSGGHPERMVGISRDVTLERQSQQERERLLKSARDARDEAERQGRLKDEFLATLSHELRTPMNVILGWLDILASSKPIRDRDSAMALIQRNAQLQAKLIDDLLDMNRLISGNLQLEIAPVDIGNTLHTTLQGLKPAADAKNLELVARVQAPTVQVLADGKRIQQVVSNLLHNAIKFTSEGRVEARVERREGEVQLIVQDTGRGISASFLPHVFERFRQEDSSSTRESFGLGLGLSITKHIVELHGGTITAESSGPGQGATFIVRLPVAAKTDTGLPLSTKGGSALAKSGADEPRRDSGRTKSSRVRSAPALYD